LFFLFFSYLFFYIRFIKVTSSKPSFLKIAISLELYVVPLKLDGNYRQIPPLCQVNFLISGWNISICGFLLFFACFILYLALCYVLLFTFLFYFFISIHIFMWKLSIYSVYLFLIYSKKFISEKKFVFFI